MEHKDRACIEIALSQEVKVKYMGEPSEEFLDRSEAFFDLARKRYAVMTGKTLSAYLEYPEEVTRWPEAAALVVKREEDK